MTSVTFSCLLIIPLLLLKYATEKCKINRGSYMSIHVLLILLNELRKRDKMRGLPSFFFATSLIN